MDSATGAARNYEPVRGAGVKRQRVDPFSGGLALRRPMSTDDRLILPFSPGACCGAGPGLDPEVIAAVPPALAARHVSHETWRQLMTSLEAMQQRDGQSVCAVVGLIMSLVGVPLLCWKQGRYHTSLREWVNAANTKLAPLHVYLKFQQASIHADKYHEEIYWLACALGPEESDILREEPIFWSPGCCDGAIGPNPCACACCTCCCGVQRVL